jgi:hypothetical protein
MCALATVLMSLQARKKGSCADILTGGAVWRRTTRSQMPDASCWLGWSWYPPLSESLSRPLSMCSATALHTPGPKKIMVSLQNASFVSVVS